MFVMVVFGYLLYVVRLRCLMLGMVVDWYKGRGKEKRRGEEKKEKIAVGRRDQTTKLKLFP